MYVYHTCYCTAQSKRSASLVCLLDDARYTTRMRQSLVTAPDDVPPPLRMTSAKDVMDGRRTSVDAVVEATPIGFPLTVGDSWKVEYSSRAYRLQYAISHLLL